jgi:hypothetical protein
MRMISDKHVLHANASHAGHLKPPSCLFRQNTQKSKSPVWMRHSGVLSTQLSVAHGCDVIFTASPWALGAGIVQLDANVEPLE